MPKSMRCIVAGCRWLNDYDRVASKLDGIFSENFPDEIVCGMGRGVDLLGREWALEKGVPIKEFPADWDNFGKGAGPKRNQQMADYATHLAAFWDGISPGTKDMISRAKSGGLTIRIVKV